MNAVLKGTITMKMTKTMKMNNSQMMILYKEEPEGGFRSFSSLRSWLNLFGYSVYMHSRGSWANLLAKHIVIF